MIGKSANQLNLLDSAFTNCKKRVRTDNLSRSFDRLINGFKLVSMIAKSYKLSRRGRPDIPAMDRIKILFLQ